MGRKMILFIPVVIVLAIVQTSIFPKMLIMNVMPEAVFVFVCTLAYFRGSWEGLFFGLIGGLCLDFIIGRSIGFYGLIYMTACFLAGHFPRKKFWDNCIIAGALCLTTVFLAGIVSYWIKKAALFFGMGMSGVEIKTALALKTVILPQLLYNCIIFLPVYFICKKIDEFWDKDKKLMAGF